MGVFDKLKDLVGIEEIDDDEITEEEIQEAAVKLERKIIDPKQHQSAASKNEINERKVQPAPASRPSVTVSDRTGSFKLVVIEPKGFDECPKLVDNLKSRKPVIINLEKIESDTARKIFDFLSGATYALNGNVQKVANNIFVFAPENVDITASVEHKGIDFGGNQKNMWR
ncbi:MAG: cell division protein SepF [Eubacteriales Family XIII. Incertae Sedis bacterium]|nr:MAG: cell division protein SepF [Clostridiales Family XIII bacterium]